MPTFVSVIEIPPGSAIRVTAIGSDAVVLIDPGGEADLTRFVERGCAAAFVSFDPGVSELDPVGRALAEVALEAGDQVCFCFMGGLGDAVSFRSRLRVEECGL
jgi:hypothetical protein